MSPRQAGKERSSRIDPQHFRKRTWLFWSRWLAVTAAMLVFGLYVGWILWQDNLGNRTSSRAIHLSTGPLATVHASIENDCQACHAQSLGAGTNLGLSSDSWQLDKNARLETQSQKCGTCHSEAHNALSWHSRDKLKDSDRDKDCAYCHQDHQGRGFSLTAMNDSVCTQCHQDLSAACKAGHTPTIKASVIDFSVKSHGPEFRSLASDTGRIKFNHAEHMLPGQVAEGHKGAFTVDMLRSPKRYKGDGQQQVQLQCEDCHQPLKTNDTAHHNSQDANDGRSYAPISFEQHCSECHQLNFAGQTSDNVPLPHFASVQEYERLISFNLRAEKVSGRLSASADKVLGKDELGAVPNAMRPIDLKDDLVENGVKAIFARCVQCHQPSDVQVDWKMRAVAKPVSLTLRGQHQAFIPERWLQYGAYNHAAHKQILCAFCHPGTSARDDVTTSVINSQKEAAGEDRLGNAVDQLIVKIKGVETCVQCHRPAELTANLTLDTPEKRKTVLGKANQPAWASDACTTCHRYHWTRPVVPGAP